jgi:predicted RNase H-related nuclease YkuK (DUF458 family)
MFTEEEKAEIAEYLERTPGRIYLGCDSVKYKKNRQWWGRYATVLVVHIENHKGCKVFGYIDRERDYDAKSDKPRLRLMNEVYKVAELYLAFGELLEDREVEIHLDVNPKMEYESSAVVKQAVGYILGVTGIKPHIKPQAFAASYAADEGARKDRF